MTRFIACLILILGWTAPIANALDSDIRVLGFYFDGVADFQESVTALAKIPAVWNSTAVGGPTPTTVTLVNGGAPLPIAPVPGSTAGVLMLNMKLNSEIATARAAWKADVVIVFIGDPVADGTCGYADMFIPGHWVDTPVSTTSAFIGDPVTGLDLRGANLSFIGYGATDGGNCEDHLEIGAHEFGHLLGAGHINDPAPDNHSWLYTDSHAYSYQLSLFGILKTFQTVMGENIPCKVRCATMQKYSTGGHPTGSATANNRTALRKTGRSVANYMTGVGTGSGGGPGIECADGADNDGDGRTDLEDGDCENSGDVTESGTSGPPSPPAGSGGCSVLPPSSVSSFQVGGNCNPGPPWTKYNVGWGNASSCLPDFYEIYAAQPVGTPYFLLGTTDFNTADIFVNTLAANIRIRGCVNGLGCTGLSSGSTTLIPKC